MANLYLTEQGAVLRKTGRRVVVTKKKEVLLEVPCHQLDSVLLFGNVHFTTPALRQLSNHGIGLALLTRRGRLLCRLAPPNGKNVPLRIAQYERARDEVFALDLARTIVAARLGNALSLLQRHIRNHGDSDVFTEVSDIEQGIRRAAEAASLPSLLGIEGVATRAWFAAFEKMIRVPLAFPGRHRRPPPDPVNAMLSLGYTMLHQEIASLLDGVGLDPFVGFYHQPDYGRRSLAADLVEEFRAPIVERFVLRLLNNRVLGADDFETLEGKSGIQLKKEALRHFLKEYDGFVGAGAAMTDDGEPQDLRENLRRQAFRMARAVLTALPYEAYRCST